MSAALPLVSLRSSRGPDVEVRAAAPSSRAAAAPAAHTTRLRVRLSAGRCRALPLELAGGGAYVSLQIAAGLEEAWESAPAALQPDGCAAFAVGGYIGDVADLVTAVDHLRVKLVARRGVDVDARRGADSEAAAIVGTVRVPLEFLTAGPGAVDGVYSGWLALSPPGTTGRCSGEVFLRLELVGTLPPTPRRLAAAEGTPATPASAALALAPSTSAPAAAPLHSSNSLRVTVHRCRGLVAEAAAAGVTVRVVANKQEVRTTARVGGPAPAFEESFAFAAWTVPAVSVIVETTAGVLTRGTPLAALTFEAGDLAGLAGTAATSSPSGAYEAPSVLSSFFPLLSPTTGAADRQRGDIELSLAFEYSPLFPYAPPAVLPGPKRLSAQQVHGLDGVSTDIAADDLAEGASTSDSAALVSTPLPALAASPSKQRRDDGNEAATASAAAAFAAAAAAAAAAVASPLREGDHTVVVHVIEARNLRPGDVGGTSDPVVFVGVLHQKQHTKIAYQRNDCVWDQTLVFKLGAGVPLAELEAGIIEVSCFNANVIARNTLIGAYSFDLQAIYSRAHHELHEVWVCLVDEARGAGVQGLLKLSIAVLGPGDRPHVHAVSDEIVDISGSASTAAESLGLPARSLVLMPPVVDRHLKFVVATVIRCDLLAPVVDRRVAGLDAVVSLSIGGGSTASSAVVPARGSEADLSAEFLAELWVPHVLPSMTDAVRLDLLDHEAFSLSGAPLRFGSVLFSFRELSSAGSPASTLVYLPIYGAAHGLDNSNSAAVRQSAFPSLASTFKGRLLASLRVEDEMHGEPAKPHCRTVQRPSDALLPRLAPFRVRALVILGDQLPAFRATAAGLLTFLGAELGVMVSLGNRSAFTARVKPESGLARFSALIEFDVGLGGGPLPDTFVYLFRGDPSGKRSSFQRLCFARLETAPLVARGFAGSVPAWQPLREDEALNAVGDDEKTGTLLLRLGVEAVQPPASASAPAFDYKRRVAELDASASEWREDLACVAPSALVPYELRVHCYRGEGLDAADSDGSLDPYLRVSVAGVTRRSAVQPKSKSPAFYETLCFPLLLLPAPAHLRFAPQVHVELYDHDAVTADDFVSEVSLHLASHECTIVSARDAAIAMAAADLPKPAWYPLSRAESSESNRDMSVHGSVVYSPAAAMSADHGRLLLSMQLLRREPAATATPLPPSPSIVPSARPHFVELCVLGLRGVQPVAGLYMQAPLLSFDVGAGSPKVLRAVSRPSGFDANICERVLLPCSVSLDPLFAGVVNVALADVRLARNVSMGTATIPLRIPWAPGFAERSSKSALYRHHPDYTQSVTTAADVGAPAPAQPAPRSAGSLIDEHGVDHNSPFLVAADGAAALGPGAHGNEALYLAGRRVYSAGLEEVLAAPFERVPLYRGQRVGRGLSPLTLSRLADDTRQCGTLKVLARLVESPDAVAPVDLFAMRSQQPVIVRLYVLTGVDLVPPQSLLGGPSSSCRPFLLLRLGADVVASSREASVQQDALSPAFFTCLEFRALLPGPSELSVECWSRGGLSDELIGRTVIDLEDRFFLQAWRGIGREHETAQRLRPKPVETRTLWCAKSRAPQGALRLWLDILTPVKAQRYPPVVVAPPPPVKVEVRLIVFGSKAADLSRGADLMVRAELHGDQAPAVGAPPAEQETDVHYAAKDGANWNWRMLFRTQLPARFPFLTVQLFHRSVLSTHALVGETVVDLSVPFRALGDHPLQVFDTDPSVVGWFRYEKLQALRRRRGREAQGSAQEPPAPGLAHSDTAVRVGGGGNGDGGDEDDDGDDDDDDTAGADDVGAGVGLKAPLLAPQQPQRRKVRGKDKGRKALGPRRGAPLSSPPPPPPPPTAPPVSGLWALVGAAAKSAANSAATAEFAQLAKLAETVATGHVDFVVFPRHARHVPVYRTADAADVGNELKSADGDDDVAGSIDAEAVQEVGELLLSIEVLPLHVAHRFPAGLGRAAPNAFPALPDPHGRTGLMNQSFGETMRGLLGLRSLLALAGLGLVTSGVAFFVGGSAIVSSLTALLQLFRSLLPPQWETAVLGTVLAALLLCCCGCCCGIARCLRKPKVLVIEVDLHGSATEVLAGEGSSDITVTRAAEDAKAFVAASSGASAAAPPKSLVARAKAARFASWARRRLQGPTAAR